MGAVSFLVIGTSTGHERARYEANIGSAVLVPDEPLLLGQDTIKDTEHAEDFLLVAFDGGWDLLGAEELEKRRLTVIWTV